MNNLIVHVGKGQSGSTTLQKHIFNNPDFGFALLTPYEQRNITIRKYVEKPRPGEFEPELCASFFEQRYSDYNNSKLIPVISNEGLSGQSFLQMDRNLESELFARRLNEVF